MSLWRLTYCLLLLHCAEREPDSYRAIRCASVWVKKNLSSLFCPLNWNLVELWSICSWPIYFWALTNLFSFSDPAAHFTLPVSSRVFYSNFCHIPGASWSHLLPYSSLTCDLFFSLSPCLLFCSHLFCCFISVKSTADVHLISYNTLNINHVSAEA